MYRCKSKCLPIKFKRIINQSCCQTQLSIYSLKFLLALFEFMKEKFIILTLWNYPVC